ncbi:MAG: DUF6431 domain-containing protein [Desulfitobacteriaceae bacterium]|nr:DUF6431 domain-containing protein [Desulfitobacteriaceae bacterium]
MLIIRRLRCTHCHRIHHELPDCLVPYKRYDCASIEQTVTETAKATDIAADEATLYRLNIWFYRQLPYLLDAL